MLEYKIHSMDRSGRIAGRVDLLCKNDEDAIRQAIAFVGLQSIELWKGDKLIARFEGFPKELS
jgi:hypothetical protein